MEIALLISRYPIDIFVLAVVLVLQLASASLLWRSASSSRMRRAVLWGLAGSAVVLVMDLVLLGRPMVYLLPVWAANLGRNLTAAWIIATVLVTAGAVALRLFRVERRHSPARRAFLRTAQAACLVGPAAATGYGVFIQRVDFRLREVDLKFPDLPEDLDGLRLVQLTDIHRSQFLSNRDLEWVVDMANETRAHIALVTGDLISSAGDPLDDCLNRLARVKSDAGTFGCLGNHEVYARSEDYTTRRGAELGMRFLRQQATDLRFGSATLNLAGVDYQPVSKPYLKGAERLKAPGAFNVLLSHNPDVFPVAAAKGFPLTIAGHTHGGQVNFEILGEDLTIARFLTPYIDGLYREGGNAVFVSRGIGTIALPVRLGVPPEVALLRLCRT